MNRILLAGAAGACLVTMAVPRSGVAHPADPGEAEAGLRRAFAARMESELDSLRGRLEEAAAAEERLGEAASALEHQLAAARSEVRMQARRIAALEGLADVVSRTDEVSQTRWDGLVRALEATTQVALETRDELGRVRTHIAADHDVQWDAMVAPTVQLAGDTTVGSGVLLPSRPVAEDGDGYTTLLVTAYHVVRDIRADSLDADAPIPVFVRGADGEKREYGARLLDHDVELDAALLALDTSQPFVAGALLPTRARLRQARVFDPVVAVGCPLGNDPIPTRGQLTDLHHTVGDDRFWMISAPTYIGNSGGGIYSSASHELLGVFTKIYTHGAIRPTVIPHMGLVTPLGAFYDWIDAGDVARVVEDDGAVAIVLR